MYPNYYNNLSQLRYAKSIEDVKREFVVGDTPYFSNDLSVLWIKNSRGEIKSYELKEIVQKGEKDLIIESLQFQMNELRKELEDAKSNNEHDVESTKSKKSSNVSNDKSEEK